MNKKAIIHCCVLGALILYTIFAWNTVQGVAEKAKEETKKAIENGEIDYWSEVKFGDSRLDEAAGMVKVGIPLLIAVIYAGVLTVIYVLPVLVDKVGEELMGSTAEVDDDPLDEARAAFAEEDYPEAIAVYRKFWLENPDDRRPLIEIAKIQRVHLENPAVAVSTLEEGLDDHEWPEEDAAFLIFRIAEIYEEDLEDRDKVVETLERAVEELKGSRHAGNAAHKLREMEVS